MKMLKEREAMKIQADRRKLEKENELMEIMLNSHLQIIKYHKKHKCVENEDNDDSLGSFIRMKRLQQSDVWSTPHSFPGSYICVTAHWIEPSTWKMMKWFIAFEYFSVPHTGSALARMLRNTFIVFNLENKVLSITLDNASNNTNSIGKLKLKYDPSIEGRFYHSRCVAHIINLVMQEDLSVPMINAIKESFKTMLKEGYISKYGKPMKEKFKKYFESRPSVITCAAALNPCYNVHGVELLIETISTNLEFFDDGHATKAKKWFNDSLEGSDILGFWKANESMFPVLSRMAMDLISVQATSVTFESVSTSGMVLSIRRTKLTPSSLQMCMCLKDHLNAQERKQHTSALENVLDFEDEILDAEVQEDEATPLSDEEIALDATSQGTMASVREENSKILILI
nr:zinc finger BED domain-containing protein RICESLEEPER 2-like [Tanacetum cinerariifolium]